MHSQVMAIEFDPAKARANLRKHSVSFAHAEQALRDPMAFTVEDPDARSEQRFVTLGMDALGRLLAVVHTQREERTRLIPLAKPVVARQINTMREEYDFSKAKRGAVVQSPGKTRITIMLDDNVIEHFRAQAEAEGVGYQTLINALLRKATVKVDKAKAEAKPLTVATLRRVLREELHTS